MQLDGVHVGAIPSLRVVACVVSQAAMDGIVKRMEKHLIHHLFAM